MMFWASRQSAVQKEERFCPPLRWKPFPLILTAAACSGAASLTLEVVWSRALVVPLGNSSDSTTAVLAGFMLGIAIGAELGARMAERSQRALAIYASLELLLALFALIVPRLVSLLALLTGAPWMPNAALAVVRWVVALLLIAVPCLVMGATLPLLLSARGHATKPGTIVGFLYGINTLGATLAAVVTGFIGIPWWGISGCSRRAALLSSLAACLALLANHALRETRNAHATSSASPPAERSDSSSAAPALLVAFVSGFVLLVAEVLWARVLTFVFGHDTYAFATLLGVVLLGLALGGLCYTGLARRDPRRIAAAALATMAFALLGSYYVAANLVIRFGRDPFGLADRFIGAGALSIEMLRELAFTPVLVLLPCVLSGINYPVAIAMFAGSRGSASRATGVIGLVNGLGASLGAGIAALGLVSWVGIQGAISAMAIVLGLASWIVLRKTCESRRALAAVPLLLVVAMTSLLPSHLSKRMLGSVVGQRHQRILYYEEARTATVSVIRNSIQGERQLLINAVNEVTTRLVHDQSFKLLGQLGPLLHPAPKRAVMVCLGAGLAAGSALTHPLERLDVVDLIASVKNGARFFDEENNHVFSDPRLVLHVNDGRQFLLATRSAYDVAIVDSTHPKSVDSWILYTREFFQLIHDRLNEGGIVVQWLPLHGLSEREFASVVATFASVFPKMTLWASVGFETYGQVGYAKLVGRKGNEPLLIDVEQMRARLATPNVTHDLERYGMSRLPEILDQFVAGPERISAWTKGVPLLTDDRPLIAYTTNLTQGRAMTPDLLFGMREFPGPFLVNRASLDEALDRDIERAFDAQGFVISGQLERALKFYPTSEKTRRYVEQTKTTLPYYSRLAEWYPSDAERLFEAGTQLASFGNPNEAQTVFRKGLGLASDSPRLRLNEGLVWLALDQPRQASRRFAELLTKQPQWALLNQNLGVALLAQGEPGAAKRVLTTSLTQNPHAIGAREALIEAEMALGQWPLAKAELLDLLRDEPHLDRAVSQLATVSEKLGEPTAALDLFARAAQMNPYREQATLEWAKRLLEIDPNAAIAVLHRAQHLFADSAAKRILIGDALSRLNQWQPASEEYLSALESDSRSADAALGLGRALAQLGRFQQARDALCLAQTLGISRAVAQSALLSLGAGFDACGVTAHAHGSR
jgi:spermidine synthase